ncbi:MAG: type II secretion system protein, partial [Candidatus Omnitrophica bacterium]|nr:type II secretion system protein [Candidatus Omnitrophota bacterium]
MKNKKGFLLITSYLVIIVLLILGSAFLLRSVNENKLIQREIMGKQAFYLAEAGIDKGLVRRRQGQSAGVINQCLQGIGCYSCNWHETAPGSNRWIITSTGTVGGISRTVQMEVIPDTYARYLYFTNSEYFRWWWWRIPVWFVTGDFLGGPLQTNG